MHPGCETGGRGRPSPPAILVVDPGMALGEAIALVFSRQAHVLRATTGIGGLMLAAERALQVVVVDGDLPDMPSGDFLRLLMLLRPGVPVACFGVEAPPPGSLEPKVNNYFPKPMELKRVLRWIAESLDQPAPPWPGVAEPRAGYDASVQHLELVRWVVEFIERCYRDGARFSEVAQAAGVSRSHLCRIFKRVTGLSLKRFLTRRRLQAAKALLRNPAMPIHQVASMVGYADPSHFHRVFRQWEGQTPSLYRRQAVRQIGRAEQACQATPTTHFPLPPCKTATSR